MLRPIANITIENADRKLLFRGCNEFKITRSVDSMSSTGTISLPRVAMRNGANDKISVSVGSEVKVNDKVTIETGYSDVETYVCFQGFVKSIDMSEKVTLNVEDSMYLIRRKSVLLSKKKGECPGLKELISEIVAGTGVTVSDRTPDLQLNEFQYEGNAAGAIAKLKEKFALTVYINEGNELYAGVYPEEVLTEDQKKEATINLTYGENVITNNAQYVSATERPLKVTVQCKGKDGTDQFTGQAGVDGGETKNYERFEIADQATADQIAQSLYSSQVYDGFRGTLTIFGIPRAVVGGIVNYNNKNYDDKNGRYLITGVDISLGEGGLRQEVSLGRKM